MAISGHNFTLPGILPSLLRLVLRQVPGTSSPIILSVLACMQIKPAEVDTFLKGGGALDINNVRKKPKVPNPDKACLNCISLLCTEPNLSNGSNHN